MDLEENKNYLKDWKENVVEKINEKEEIDKIVEYLLQISRIIDFPDIDIEKYINQIKEIGNELKKKIKNPKEMRPTQIIEKFNEFFFDDLKFQPNTNDYYNPLNNYINMVLEKRTGIPITLSILYIYLLSFLNFKLLPVNFPSHFLVKYILDESSDESIVIDPFNKGRIMDDYILNELLNKTHPRTNISISNTLLEKASTSQILIRILNNLKVGYTEIDKIDKINLINEMILSLDNFNPEAVRDKGILLFRDKRYKEALENLYKYTELNPEANDIDRILEIIKETRKHI